jgi:hypothetical protein
MLARWGIEAHHRKVWSLASSHSHAVARVPTPCAGQREDARACEAPSRPSAFLEHLPPARWQVAEGPGHEQHTGKGYQHLRVVVAVIDPCH